LCRSPIQLRPELPDGCVLSSGCLLVMLEFIVGIGDGFLICFSLGLMMLHRCLCRIRNRGTTNEGCRSWSRYYDWRLRCR